MSAVVVRRAVAVPGGDHEAFVDALVAFACAWPVEFLALARDPERMGVLCRALREAFADRLADGPGQAGAAPASA